METPCNTAESVLFSSIHAMLITVTHTLSRKTTLNQFQEIEILQSLSYGHSGIAFEINKNKSSRKITNIYVK